MIFKHMLKTVLIAALALGFSVSCAAAASFTVKNYELQSKKRVSRTDYLYTFKASALNNAEDAGNVTATLVSDSAYTKIVDGDLAFGDIQAGTTVQSQDTFSIRQNRRHKFNASALTWTFAQTGSTDESIKDLVIQPGGDTSSMRFCWYSEDTIASVVQVAKASDMTGEDFPQSFATEYTGTVSTSGDYISNKAEVTGLSKGTEYVYRVGDGTRFSDIHRFTTEDGDGEFNFLYVGDPQIGSSNDVESDSQGWQATVTTAHSTFPDAGFLLSLGDQVEKGSREDEYEGFFSPEELPNIPVAPTIGNHDNRSGLYAYHFNCPNESSDYGVTAQDDGTVGGNYYFTYGNTLFMVINSNNSNLAEHAAFFSSVENNAEVMEGIVWEVVVMHVSMYSSAAHSDDTDISTFRQYISPLFDQFNIDVVLAGHDHCYTRSHIIKGNEVVSDVATDGEGWMVNPDGILYMTANSGSGSKYYDLMTSTTRDYAAVELQGYTPTYANVEVTDNTFTITTYETDDNSVIDTCTLYKSSN
nr:metallophosphoesterase family protein [uncultured Desulfobacter sp.]